MRQFFVYILASKSRRLYVGVTNDLERRVYEHQARRVTFTSRYRIDRLVSFETTGNPVAAIQREKKIKGWLRSRKIVLIESMNPTWRDLPRPGSITPSSSDCATKQQILRYAQDDTRLRSG